MHGQAQLSPAVPPGVNTNCPLYSNYDLDLVQKLSNSDAEQYKNVCNACSPSLYLRLFSDASRGEVDFQDSILQVLFHSCGLCSSLIPNEIGLQAFC